MSFFDRKEEVIDIELTNYGRYLLSKGIFKPVYYEFFDDDITYDSQYVGYEELQGDIQTRIKETSRIKVQYSFSGVETQLKRNVELVRSGKEKNVFADRFLQTPEKHFSLSAPLGTSDISNDKNPSWKVRLLKGEIGETIRYTTGSQPTLMTPQITLKPVIYETFPAKQQLKDNSAVSDLNIATTKFQDGSYIQIKDDYVLIDIKEENAPLRNDNFDIEVYLLDKDNRSDRGNKENLIPLYFEKKKPQVVNNILVDEEDVEIRMLGPSFVQHYFNILVDKEINPETLCTVLTEDEIIALNQTGEFSFDCVNKKGNLGDTSITTDVAPEDIEDKC